LGINRRTMYRWLSAYHHGGESALQAKPIPGAPPKVRAKQMARLLRMIRDKTPLQFEYFSSSWTAFQADRGRDFNGIVDDGDGAQVIF
jgi:transposase